MQFSLSLGECQFQSGYRRRVILLAFPLTVGRPSAVGFRW